MEVKKSHACVGGITCNDGWFFILNDLCKKIQFHVDQQAEYIKKGYINNSKPITQVVALQIKEKFGGLRFYFEGGDDYIKACVDMVEHLSYGICETCGKMNEEVGRTKGWIRSLCPVCAKSEKKSIAQQKELITLMKKVKNDKKKNH